MHKLLLVDNEVIRRTFTRYAIERVYKREVEVCELPNGYEARDDIIEIKPDLVFMSVDMRDMDGIDAAVEMRKRGYNNPIILWTSRQGLLHSYQRSDLLDMWKQNPASLDILLGEEPDSETCIEMLKQHLGEPDSCS